MGRQKAMMMEDRERGFTSQDTRVCEHCLDDEEALIKFIKNNGSKKQPCSYCDEDQRAAYSVDFDVFVGHLLLCIETEWGDPNNEGLAHDKDGWDGAYDTHDLFDHLAIDIKHSQLEEDLIYALLDRQWCQKDPYGLPFSQELAFGWRNFCKVIKHESRYVFFRREEQSDTLWNRENLPASEFLDALGSVITECDLYSVLPANTALCRLRTHDADKNYTTAADLGAPPPTLAKFPNRMSAAGISAFYAAFDKETAIAETTHSLVDKTKPIFGSLGWFRPVRDLFVVDLTRLPPRPSIFEPDSYDKRHGVLFLREFVDDFAAPVRKDGYEHIDYVPTQVVSEYLRFIHRGPKDEPIDGILYNSTRQSGGKAIVLFIDNKGSCGPGYEKDHTLLVLTGHERLEVPGTGA